MGGWDDSSDGDGRVGWAGTEVGTGAFTGYQDWAGLSASRLRSGRHRAVAQLRAQLALKNSNAGRQRAGTGSPALCRGQMAPALAFAASPPASK